MKRTGFNQAKTLLFSKVQVKSNKIISLVFLMLFIPTKMAYADQGIEVTDNKAVMYFDNENWTGSWSYLCINNNCVSGVFNDSRWERDVSNIGITQGTEYTVTAIAEGTDTTH